MASIKLIATDLDGTLLDSTGKITEANKSALREAQNRGIMVTICTGRMFSSARRFAAQLNIDLPLICYNGAMVRSPEGKTLSHLPLELGAAKRLLAIFRERDIYVQSYIDDMLFVRDADEQEFQMYVRHFGVTGAPIGDAVFEPKVAPTKLLTVNESVDAAEALMYELQRMFGEEVYVTRSNADFVEVMNPRAGKARALATLAADLGIPMDSVMAIGDGENDAEMIAEAGVGIAVANARERPKEGARDVAPSNDDDGVAWAVGRYALVS